MDPGDPVIVLRGNSLRIYLYLLRMRRPMGVRDIWRELDISSPSLVQYHIDRLLNMGLVVKSGDGYRAVYDGRVYPLGEALIIMGRAVPRFAFYFFTILGVLASYTLLTQELDIYVILVGALSLLFTGIEMIRQWRVMRRFMEGGVES